MEEHGSMPSGAGPAEQALVDQLRAGDEPSFATLIDTYHPALLRLARQYVDSETVAGEVVQDTWIAFLDSLSRFEGRSSLKTWIFRILVNTARSRRRREARSIPFSAAFPAEDSGREPSPGSFVPAWMPRVGGHWLSAPPSWRGLPEQAALSAETVALVRSAIAALPPSQREVITLRDVEGYSADEVCNILGVTGTNQRVLLHRARTRIRQALAPHMAETA